MSWQNVLKQDDYRFYKENISLLEDQIINNFPDSYQNTDILTAIRNVPRHFFVNQSYKYLAYTDHAFPTYASLTTSAPSVIAEMIFRVGIKKGDKLLEIGTGTGYEAAVLSELGVNVFTIEIDKQLATTANRILMNLGYKINKKLKTDKKRKKMIREFNEIKNLFPHRGKIKLYFGNGQSGLKEYSPFHGIIIAASISYLKQIKNLINQL